MFVSGRFAVLSDKFRRANSKAVSKCHVLVVLFFAGVPPSYGMPWITSTGNNHAGLPNIRMKCLSCTVVLYDALWACGESDAECSRSIELCVLSMACSVECIRFKVLCGFSWIRACSVQLVNLFIFTSHRSFYPSTSSILCVRADSSF